MEISQSNRIAIAQAESDLRNLNLESNRSVIENPQLIELMTKLTKPNEPLSQEELLSSRYYAQNLNLIWSTAEENYMNGLISEESFTTWFENIEYMFVTYPGLGRIYA